ncbi:MULTISPECIES: ORF6C domain-containing protein [Paenibacillus]|uniref:ABC transporter permease n=1 Tax=Paenibacillus odorifer TaxID=189426 RepID=A0A1R0YTZ3_9BACL|nr:ORF6C domain-containing protein [Paenibacillus odorifer]AWV35194.1 ABC transporter permease [Paenibacillus odorifer]OME10689.1 ABC transporter permease [Paenibacillus odorifer]
METDKILAVVGQQLHWSEQQGAAVRMLFDGMVAIKSEMAEDKEEMKMMVQEVRDSVTLIDAECDLMQQAVRLKSIELTKHRFKDSDMKFNEMVGRYRRMIWSKLKESFSVAKYSHLRRIDFEDAIEFVKNFQPEDYI